MNDNWYQYLKTKYTLLTDEPIIPTKTIGLYTGEVLNRETFNNALSQMKNDKATGPDNTPVEIFKYDKTLRENLYDLLNQVQQTFQITWLKEKWYLATRKKEIQIFTKTTEW